MLQAFLFLLSLLALTVLAPRREETRQELFLV